MPTLTPAETTTLRSQSPHAAKLSWYLALAPYGDATFTALVNDAGIARGERDIVYDGDTGENTVLPGMTLWVGSAAGLYDIGRIRIRSVNTGTNTITVAENDDIDWADDLHLTCPGQAGFRELWGIYPRITEAGGVVTFYEDYDELYVNPLDDILPPKANAGPPVAEFLGTSGYVDVSFTGDESFTTEVGAAIATYLWDFSDGVVQSGSVNAAGTCAVPNVVRFSTTGFRYVSLTVTDNTGQARTGTIYIPVWIFNRTTAAPLSVEVQSQSGDPEWKLSVKAFSTETNTDDVFYNYPNGALAVLFTETEYPDDSADIGGFCFRSNIRYTGWLDAESLSFDYDSGTVIFNVISHDLRLSELPGFAYTLQDDITPSDWYEVNDLNIDRALHAHLERKSTTNQVCHVERLGEATRTISVQGFPDASIYDQAQAHLLKDAMAMMLSDRQGVLRVRRDPQFMDAGDRNAVDVVVSLTTTDILDEIDETRRHQDELGYVRLGGFAYETPLLSEAPGVAPSQSEAATYTEGLLVEDQAELNLWTGLWWEKENNDYKQVPIEMKGYWPVFDPAFQEYIRLTAVDTLGRNVFTNQRFIVRRVTFGDLIADGTTTTELILEKETDILSGETVTIPVPPPPEPPPAPPPIVIIPVEPPEFALVHSRSQVFSTSNFDAVAPTWTNITGGLVGAICAVECDYFDGVGAWATTRDPAVETDDTSVNTGLWRTDDVTIPIPIWTLVFTQDDGKNERPTWGPSCTPPTGQPQWGQLRNIAPSGPGTCLVGEVKRLTAQLITDASAIYEVDSVGGFVYYSEDVAWSPGGEGWIWRCGGCGSNADFHANARFFERGMIQTRVAKRSMHGLYRHQSGSVIPAGTVHWLDQDGYCAAPAYCHGGLCPAVCRRKSPWPFHPDAICDQHMDGAVHVIYYNGAFLAQAEEDLLGNQTGSIYSSSTGEIDSILWSNYAFCNICSHNDHYYYCKEISGILPRVNELYMDAIATGIRSNDLFGDGGLTWHAGVIGHIRAIWDEDQTVVLVRKDEPDLPGQLDTHVIWTWDPVNGLNDKTGNLTGTTWRGTGSDVPPAGWHHTWDNVGFSAFGVPLR